VGQNWTPMVGQYSMPMDSSDNKLKNNNDRYFKGADIQLGSMIYV